MPSSTASLTIRQPQAVRLRAALQKHRKRNNEGAAVQACRKECGDIPQNPRLQERGHGDSLVPPDGPPNRNLRSDNACIRQTLQSELEYRQTGVALLGLEEDAMVQLGLFEAALSVEKMRKIYESVDEVRRKYGKHTLFLGSSFLANKFDQHLGKRGDIPKRKETLLKGETTRKRLGIPMFLADVE